MLPPQKPWEVITANQRAVPSAPNSEGLQSSVTNVGTYAGGPHSRASVRNPPPLPPRSNRQRYQNGIGLGYGSSNYYGSPFSSINGYGSGLNSYSSYGYNGYNNYSNYGSYNSYGGYGGINRLGFQHAMPESRFIQMAEDGTRPAFQSIESLVHAFGSVSFMLESTFNAMYSSFRAVLGVAENFGRLRALFGQFLSVFAVYRWLQWLYKKCLYLLGLRSDDPGREQLWQQASQGAMGDMGGNIESNRQRTSWPILVFLGIILSGPYLMWKLLSTMEIPNIDPYNVKDWSKCKVSGHTAIAVYDFPAASAQELSLQAGQKILIAPKDCQQSQNWLLASVDGKKVGLVPVNYIKIVGHLMVKTRKESQFHSSAMSEDRVSDVASSTETKTEDVAGSASPEINDIQAPEHPSSTETPNNMENFV